MCQNTLYALYHFPLYKRFDKCSEQNYSQNQMSCTSRIFNFMKTLIKCRNEVEDEITEDDNYTTDRNSKYSVII